MKDIAEQFAQLMSQSRMRKRMGWTPPYGTDYARTLSTKKPKELWDKYDGIDTSIGDEKISGEAIHLVLNERKEGKYCAV